MIFSRLFVSPNTFAMCGDFRLGSCIFLKKYQRSPAFFTTVQKWITLFRRCGFIGTVRPGYYFKACFHAERGNELLLKKRKPKNKVCPIPIYNFIQAITPLRWWENQPRQLLGPHDAPCSETCCLQSGLCRISRVNPGFIYICPRMMLPWCPSTNGQFARFRR